MDLSFEGKVVLVTGGSAGIGLACAERFAAEGAQVVLVARGASRLDAAVAGIEAAGGAAAGIAADMGNAADCERVVATALTEFGGVDVLVNNAGLHHRGPVADNGPEDLSAMIDVNLRSPIFLTRLVLPHLLARKGAVVNVASLAGCVPVPGSAVYSASKFGLRAFSHALAAELRGTGVRVSCVSPGPVDTGFIMDNLDDVSDLTFSQPIVTAAQVAEAVVACAIDGRLERKLPRASGLLATVGYLFPSLKRLLRPLLERKGAKVRVRLIEERSAAPRPGVDLPR